MPTKEQIVKWKKFVDESNGAAFFVPDELKNDIENYEKERSAFNDELVKIQETEVRLKVKLQDIMLKVRENRKKNGDEKIFAKDINLVMEAVEDGVFIIHSIDPSKQR